MTEQIDTVFQMFGWKVVNFETKRLLEKFTNARLFTVCKYLISRFDCTDLPYCERPQIGFQYRENISIRYFELNFAKYLVRIARFISFN